MADSIQCTPSPLDGDVGRARRKAPFRYTDEAPPRREARTRARGFAIDGIEINMATPRTVRAEVARRAVARNGFTLFTLNLDHLTRLDADPGFRAAYARANLVTADGWPIVWLAGRDGFALERACGADLVEPICEDAAISGLPTYFIGPGRIAQAMAIHTLEQRHPGLKVAGAEAPRLQPTLDDAEINAMAARLRRSGARLCFISLGAPKQELLADRLARACPDVGFICVGAALDFISGRSRRAPAWLQRLKLEWLWRLASEPRRLGGRYVRCGRFFVRLAMGGKFPSRETVR